MLRLIESNWIDFIFKQELRNKNRKVSLKKIIHVYTIYGRTYEHGIGKLQKQFKLNKRNLKALSSLNLRQYFCVHNLLIVVFISF